MAVLTHVIFFISVPRINSGKSLNETSCGECLLQVQSKSPAKAASPGCDADGAGLPPVGCHKSLGWDSVLVQFGTPGDRGCGSGMGGALASGIVFFVACLLLLSCQTPFLNPETSP